MSVIFRSRTVRILYACVRFYENKALLVLLLLPISPVILTVFVYFGQQKAT